MKFTPHCIVSYKGSFHKAGVSFDIDANDAKEMKKYGKVEETMRDDSQNRSSGNNNANTAVQTASEDKQSKRQAGRPRKLEQ